MWFRQVFHTAILASLLILLGSPSVMQPDCTDGLPSRLQVNSQAQIISAAGSNARLTPARDGELLGSMPNETIVIVYNGPVCAEGMNWWLVGSDRLIGWTVEGAEGSYWLEPLTDLSTTGLNGVQITYDAEIVGDPTIDMIPGSEDQSLFAFPEHIEFVFLDYLITGGDFPAVIRIYDVDEYRALDENAGLEFDKFAAIMAERPSLVNYLPENEIAHLPDINVARTPRTQWQYLDFQNGSGYRYVTTFTQTYSVPRGDSLLYIFQGMNDDGKLYISAQFPVETDVLLHFDAETGFEILSGLFSRFSLEEEVLYDAFSTGATYVIDSLPPAMFTPDIRALDAMMQSLLAGLPGE